MYEGEGAGLSRFAGLFELVRATSRTTMTARRAARAAIPAAAPVDPAPAAARSGPRDPDGRARGLVAPYAGRPSTVIDVRCELSLRASSTTPQY
jgi:hypothetical protein